MINSVEVRKAKYLAKEFSPIFIQEFKKKWDLITPFNFGDWVYPYTPTIYYAIKEDDSNYYLHYMIYHYKDWSNWPKFIRSLDEHRHDLEGVILCVDKKYSRTKWVASRFHFEMRMLKLNSSFKQSFSIEAGGHGIRPGFRGSVLENYITYADYKLVNLIHPDHWQRVVKQVMPTLQKEGVTFPWQWNDYRIRRKEGMNSDGLIWRDPQKFYKFAKNAQII